ncbi:MAG: T9SS type A sorting domain-containing protein [Flavobacteriales bacterium]|nr:T9SS type A sorting domain-containing protein [Flavobacteriales bacterium]
MKRSLVIWPVLLITFIVHGQTSFIKTYGTANDDQGYAVTKTLDGGYLIGTPYDDGHWGLIKTNDVGDTTWTRTYPFLKTSLYYQFNSSVSQLSDGNYVLIGGLADSNSFVLKVNGAGDTLWVKKSGHNQYPVVYRKLVEDTYGNLIVIGSQPIINSVCCSPLMQKLDHSGNLISDWSNKISCPYSTGCRLNDIFIDHNGNYLVTGETPYSNTPVPRLTKISPSGTVVWNQYYPVNSASSQSITEAPDSGFLLVATDVLYDSLILCKTDKNGNFEWVKRYGEYAKTWYSPAIRKTTSGYLVAGYHDDVFLMKLDLNYNVLWMRSYGGSSNEEFRQMVTTTDGGCALIGSTKSYGNGENDVYFIKTDSLGIAVGTMDISNEHHQLSIYPNPFSATTTLETDLVLSGFGVYDISGRLVKRELNTSSGQRIIIDRGSLPMGIYVLEVYVKNGTVMRTKLIIN